MSERLGGIHLNNLRGLQESLKLTLPEKHSMAAPQKVDARAMQMH